MTLANLHSCDEMGVCLVRNPPCRRQCQLAQRRDIVPTIDLDDTCPELQADGCMRALWLLVCVVLSILIAIVVLGLLWRYEATLRPALHSLVDSLVAMYLSTLQSLQ